MTQRNIAISRNVPVNPSIRLMAWEAIRTATTVDLAARRIADREAP
jgi:hypothetical protein